MMVRQLPRCRGPLLVALTLLLILPISGDVFLLLMKLHVVPLTKSLLSYVALVTNGHAWLNYICALLLAFTVLCYLWPWSRSRHVVSQRQKPLPNVKRWQRTAMSGDFVFIVAGIGGGRCGSVYWDKVASQPPQLSEALPVTLSSDGLVHIPVEQVRDGKLHRFVWIADDGKAVRFLLSTAIQTDCA